MTHLILDTILFLIVFNIPESESDAKGVLREVWNMYDSSVEDFEEIDDVIVDLWHVIKTLHAPVNFGNLYLQKLSGYFQVKWLISSGSVLINESN